MQTIVNVAQDWGIGKDNDLLFHWKEDMKFFRQTTSGKVVIMGRKTLDSFPGGRPLPKRRNIVITRDPAFAREGAEVVHSVEEAVELVRDLPSEEVFVIGGAGIYEQMLPYCDRAYVTRTEAVKEATAYFPDLSLLPEWQQVWAGEPLEEGGITFRFTTWERRQPE